MRSDLIIDRTLPNASIQDFAVVEVISLSKAREVEFDFVWFLINDVVLSIGDRAFIGLYSRKRVIRFNSFTSSIRKWVFP